MRPSKKPTQEELAAAFRSGSPVRFGLPSTVIQEGKIACLNLAAAHKGHPDPWFVVEQKAPGVFDLEMASARGLFVAGLRVSADDLCYVDEALRIAPGPEERHNAEANDRRLEAGRIAMKVSNTMVRARLIDAIDGWEVMIDHGTVLDEDEKEGILISPPEEMGIECNILIVTCPSTGRRYAPPVPTQFTTAYAARTWIMKGLRPEVET